MDTRDTARGVLLVAVVGIVTGIAARLFGNHGLADGAWAVVTVVALVPLSFVVARDLMHGETGVDLIALLAIGGSLILGEYLAGAVVAVMLSGGQTLESFASHRARQELTSLLSRAPRVAFRYSDGGLTQIDVEEVVPGDKLFVRAGDVVAVDGVVEDEIATIDASAMTGESEAVELARGDRVVSGTSNAGSGFAMVAIATSDESTYAGIVRLVEAAQSSKAPFVRLADRYAVWFLPLTLVVAGAAWWLSGDSVRALAVLVVATPCPLILAAPIAIVSGMSQSAHRGIIVKSGGALETLARAETAILDKTGTLTIGTPSVGDVITDDESPQEILRLAASLDQVSPHIFAAAVVAAARAEGANLSFPSDVNEAPGSGISGRVDGRRVALGKASWLEPHELPTWAQNARKRAESEGASSIFVALDGRLAGAIMLEDEIRADASAAIERLRRSGVRRVVMATGDHVQAAQRVGAALGVDATLADLTPLHKVEAVGLERRHAITIMVGDGINDAPALAAADVGIAMGARGASASSEASDVVITVDRLDRVATALSIARRARSIAVQSVIAGMALSIVAMGFAAVGLLVPVAGAMVQEAIDVAVILNALRALRALPDDPPPTVTQHQPLPDTPNRVRMDPTY